MKYSAPYGVSDPDAHYINGNPQTGVQGSIPPASAFEENQRELVNFIIQSNISPDDGDLYQVTKAVRSQFLNVIRDVSTTANSITCQFSPPIDTYTLGLPLRVIVAHTNTGNTTINAGPGLVQLVRTDGSALQAGDIMAGGIAVMTFDGTRFQLMNFLGATSGGSANYYIKIPYIADTSPTANIIEAIFSPAITPPIPGDLILVKLANAFTGPTTIKTTTTTGVITSSVTRPDQSALSSGDGVPGQLMLMAWDGARWQFMNPRYATLAFGYIQYTTAGVYTFTVPANVYRLIRVRLWGAGGGGGAGYPYGPSGTTGGGGGGGGGYSELVGVNVVPGQTITVTIGGGGNGTPAFNWYTGTNGGSSSFGAMISATGGKGGTSGYPSSVGFGGNAGSGSGGTVNMFGERGRQSALSTPAEAGAEGGTGGASAKIGVASTGTSNYPTTPATQVNGAGGAGGSAFVAAAYFSSPGADGGDGRCEIEWRV